MHEKLEAVEKLVDIDLEAFLGDSDDPDCETEFFDLDREEDP